MERRGKTVDNMTLGAVTLAVLHGFTPGQMPSAQGEATFCVNDFPKVKLLRGNFPELRKKNKRIAGDIIQWVNKNPKRLN